MNDKVKAVIWVAAIVSVVFAFTAIVCTGMITRTLRQLQKDQFAYLEKNQPARRETDTRRELARILSRIEAQDSGPAAQRRPARPPVGMPPQSQEEKPQAPEKA
jgi:hypothetical protein